MPMGNGTLLGPETFWPADQIREEAQRRLRLTPEKDQEAEAGPARMYRVEGGKGRMGFITAMTCQFCGSCNRLRLTSDGHVRTCLFDDKEYRLRGLLRHPRCNDADLVRVLRLACAQKPLGAEILAPGGPGAPWPANRWWVEEGEAVIAYVEGRLAQVWANTALVVTQGGVGYAVGLPAHTPGFCRGVERPWPLHQPGRAGRRALELFGFLPVLRSGRPLKRWCPFHAVARARRWAFCPFSARRFAASGAGRRRAGPDPRFGHRQKRPSTIFLELKYKP